MKKNNLHIFNSNLNNKLKVISLDSQFCGSGQLKYIHPVSKEWKNTVYTYNQNTMKNIPVNNINANKIIQSYFNLYFKNNFIKSQFVGNKIRRSFIRKLYVSNLETKHRNSKIIMTLYTLNLEKNKLQKQYLENLGLFSKKISKYLRLKLRKRINVFSHEAIENKNLLYNEFKNTNLHKDLFIYKHKLLSESMNWYSLYIKLYLTRMIKNFFDGKLKYLRKSELNYQLNKQKFELFIPKLGNILSKLYNNKVEFNLINLKSLSLNSDMLTEILTLKLEKRNGIANNLMDNILKKVTLPQTNHILEKNKGLINTDYSLLENQKNVNLLSVIKKKSESCGLNKILKEITSYTDEESSKTSISDMIFKSIEYKNIGGVRLEVKGRLSRRNRADRSAFTLKWKGGLKDITSSYKGLSTTMYRGHIKPNIHYSWSSSKRPVGAFAVKGWISGK